MSEWINIQIALMYCSLAYFYFYFERKKTLVFRLVIHYYGYLDGGSAPAIK